MNKLYLAICGVALAFTAQARQLSFYIDDTPITSGSTIEFTDVIVDDYGTAMDVTMAPNLYVSTDLFTNELTVKATCTSGEMISMCAGGNCSSGTTVTKEGVTVQTGEKLPLRFEYMATELDSGTEIPTVTTLIEAEVAGDAGTHIEFVIVMGPEGASVVEIERAQSVVVTSAGLVYNLDAPATLTLYNMCGNRVLEAGLSGSGVLNTGNLARGLYIYSLGGKSGKLFIK